MDRLENAYRMIPIDRLKINTFRLLNKINEYDNKNNNIVQVSDKNNIEFKKQLKQASLMINVIEKRLTIMGEKATPGEKFAFENDIRDLKSKYSKISVNFSKLNNNNNNNNNDTNNNNNNNVGKEQLSNNLDLSNSGEEESDEGEEDQFDETVELMPKIINNNNKTVHKKKKRFLNRLASVKFEAKSAMDLEQSKKQRRKMMERNKNINALNELVKFRKELNLDSEELNPASYNDNMAQEERDRQIEEILATAKALKEATLNTKNKVSTSNKVMDDFQKNMEKMVDKTDILNKKTTASLNATWDVLKLQCSILIFSVLAVVGLFFVMRIFPKQF